MITILLAVFSLFTFAGPRSISSVTEPVVPTYPDCIRSLAQTPATPSNPKLYFQKLAGAESFVLRCHESDTKEFMRFTFVQQEKVYSLKLPFYYYKDKFANGQSESTELPRNIVHFTHQGKDLYIQLQFSDVANVFDASKLPALSKEMMISLSKIQNDYVKKYEDFLATSKSQKAIILTEALGAERAVSDGCLDRKKQEILKLYMQGKFAKVIPALGTISDDSENFATLSEADKKKYLKKWEDYEAEAAEELVKSHPLCEGIFAPEDPAQAFKKAYENNSASYETLRKYLFE